MCTQNDLGEERRKLHERCLAIFIIHEGPDGKNIAIGQISIAEYYEQLSRKKNTVDLKRSHLLLPKYHFEEAFRIRVKIYGRYDSCTMYALRQSGAISLQLSYVSFLMIFTEAPPFSRQMPIIIIFANFLYFFYTYLLHFIYACLSYLCLSKLGSTNFHKCIKTSSL
jgi:hypothetical protein